MKSHLDFENRFCIRAVMSAATASGRNRGRNHRGSLAVNFLTLRLLID